MAKGTKGDKPAQEGDKGEGTQGPPTAPVVVELTVGGKTVTVFEREIDLRMLGGLKGGRRPALLESVAGDIYDAVLNELRKIQGA